MAESYTDLIKISSTRGVMGWWLVAMLSWLAGVGAQVSQADIASRAVMYGVGGLSALIMVLAIGLRQLRWARLGVLALFGLAWASTSWRAAQRLDEHLPSVLSAQTVQARVQVEGLVQDASGGYLFDARVLAYRDPVEGKWLHPDRMPSGQWPGTVAIRLNKSNAKSNNQGDVIHPRPGQQWVLSLRMHAPDGPSNPGGYDVELGYWERGVRAVAQGRVQQAHLLSPDPEWFWQGWVDRLRSDIRDRIRMQVPQTRWAGVLSGLAVGDQSAIERQDWDVFRQTGVSHLVSISGGHVAMFGWLAACLIRPLWLRSGHLAWRIASPDAARVGAVVAAGLYALLAGWGVPAQRTVLMMAVFSALRVSGRQWPWPLVWLLAAVVVTIWDPWACMQAGFWLSFVAVGILMSVGMDEGAVTVGPRAWYQPIKRAAIQLWATQWRVSLGLAPLSLVFFQQTSLVGLLANLLAIPVFTFVITPLALLGAAMPPLWTVGAYILDWTLQGLTWLAQSPMAMVQSTLLPLWASVAVVCAGAGLIWPMRWAWRAMLLPFLLPLVYLPASWQAWAVPRPGQFTLLAADVGQGSAILIQTAGHALLFDTGPKVGLSSDAGARVLVPLMRALGLGHLDVVMVSHADTDHIGGAVSVYQAMAVEQLWSPLPPEHALRQTPSANGRVPVHHDCLAGQSWVWDDVQFKVLRPSASDLAQRDRLPDNALSCVLQVTALGDARHGNANPAHRVALLTGDVEAEQERAMVDTLEPQALRADLLVVPHHGSQTSSTQAFLEAVRPAQSVIQVGRRNRYGHPAPSVLKRYQSLGLPFVTTPECGAFLWRSEATGLEGQCWRDMHRHYWQPQAEKWQATGLAADADSDSRGQ